MSLDADSDFERYVEGSRNNSLPFFLMITLREKMKLINETYKITLSHRNVCESADLEEKMDKFISELMDATNQTIKQFDILMASEISADLPDEDDDEDNIPDEGEDELY